MKPEFSPPSVVRNAGSPSERFGFTRRSTRRSEMFASSDVAIASASSAKASGWRGMGSPQPLRLASVLRPHSGDDQPAPDDEYRARVSAVDAVLAGYEEELRT